MEPQIPPSQCLSQTVLLPWRCLCCFWPFHSQQTTCSSVSVGRWKPSCEKPSLQTGLCASFSSIPPFPRRQTGPSPSPAPLMSFILFCLPTSAYGIFILSLPSSPLPAGLLQQLQMCHSLFLHQALPIPQCPLSSENFSAEQTVLPFTLQPAAPWAPSPLFL